MNIDNIKALIESLQKTDFFSWGDRNLCIASHVPENLRSYFGVEKALASYLEISTMKSEFLYLGKYLFNGNSIDYNQLTNLNKNSALRLLNKCLELGRVPTTQEFEFVEEDFD